MSPHASKSCLGGESERGPLATSSCKNALALDIHVRQQDLLWKHTGIRGCHFKGWLHGWTRHACRSFGQYYAIQECKHVTPRGKLKRNDLSRSVHMLAMPCLHWCPTDYVWLHGTTTHQTCSKSSCALQHTKTQPFAQPRQISNQACRCVRIYVLPGTA